MEQQTETHQHSFREERHGEKNEAPALAALHDTTARLELELRNVSLHRVVFCLLSCPECSDRANGGQSFGSDTHQTPLEQCPRQLYGTVLSARESPFSPHGRQRRTRPPNSRRGAFNYGDVQVGRSVWSFHSRHAHGLDRPKKSGLNHRFVRSIAG